MKKFPVLVIALLYASISSAQILTFEWAKQISGNGHQQGEGITVDATGNVYSVGRFNGTVDLDPGPGVQEFISGGWNDTYIQKLDPIGNLIWVKRIGTSVQSAPVFSSIAVDNSGNVYVTGEFQGTVDFNPGTGVENLIASAQGDIYLLKLDVNGNFLWVKQITSEGAKGAALSLDDDETIFLLGYFSGTADFGLGVTVQNLTSIGINDAFIQKIDANGNPIWIKQFGGSGQDSADYFDFDALGNLYIAGRFNQTADFDPGIGVYNLISNGGFDVYIQKLNSFGEFIWAKNFGGTDNEFVFGLSVDAIGNVHSTGRFRQNADFDPDSGVFNLTSQGNDDIYIQKLNANGNFLWAKRIGDVFADKPSGIHVNLDGTICVSGEFQDTVDFDPNIGIDNRISFGSTDCFIQLLDSDGNHLSVQTFGGDEQEVIQDMSVDTYGNVHATGFFSDTISFNTSQGVYQLFENENLGYDGFIVKFGGTVGFNDLESNFELRLFPIPTNGVFTIQVQTNQEIHQVNILDAMGRLVQRSDPKNSNTIQVDLDLPSGMYFVEVFGSFGVRRSTLIKE